MIGLAERRKRATAAKTTVIHEWIALDRHNAKSSRRRGAAIVLCVYGLTAASRECLARGIFGLQERFLQSPSQAVSIPMLASKNAGRGF
jgi:hypothetical protein